MGSGKGSRKKLLAADAHLGKTRVSTLVSSNLVGLLTMMYFHVK